MSEDSNTSRRRILQLSALAGSGLFSSGIATATNENKGTDLADTNDPAGSLSALTVKDGKVVVEQSGSPVRGPHPKDSGISIREIATTINAEIKKGYWNPIERNSRVFLKPTDAGKRRIRQVMSAHGIESTDNHRFP
jgi:hypothetical protein